MALIFITLDNERRTLGQHWDCLLMCRETVAFCMASAERWQGGGKEDDKLRSDNCLSKSLRKCHELNKGETGIKWEAKGDSTFFKKEVERVFMKIYLRIISKTLSGKISFVAFNLSKYFAFCLICKLILQS